MRRELQPITMSAALEQTLASSATERLKEKARLVNQLDRVISEYPLEDSSNEQKDWLGLEDTERVRDLEKTIEALHKRYGKNVVLMDETSIGVVDDLIEGRGALTPLGLVDLSTFVTNFILRDRVIRTERLGTSRANDPPWKGPWIDHVPFFGSLADTVRQSTLTWLDSLQKGRDANQGMRSALADGWKLLVGSSAPPPGKQFGELSWFSETAVEDLMFRIYYDERVTKGAVAARRRAIAQSNQRALFNLELSRILQIPYAGSICRLPVRKYLWEQGRWSDALLSSIPNSDVTTVTILDDAYRKRVQAILPNRESVVVLPALLAAVLQRIDRLDQFEERLAELRKQAAPLRKRLSQIESGLQGNKQEKEVKRLLDAFSDDVRVFRRTVSESIPYALAIAGIVLKAATGQPAWLTATLGVLAAPDKLSKRTFVRLRNRVVRRDLWFVTEIGSTASALLNPQSKLEKFWRPQRGVGFGSEFAKRLERISQLQYH